jgi:hypothetical protein
LENVSPLLTGSGGPEKFIAVENAAIEDVEQEFAR